MSPLPIDHPDRTPSNLPLNAVYLRAVSFRRTAIPNWEVEGNHHAPECPPDALQSILFNAKRKSDLGDLLSQKSKYNK